MSKYVINDSTLVAIGDAVREKDGTTAPIVVSDLANRIKAIPQEGGGGGGIPEESFTVSGNCNYRFANGGWDWFIELYGNKITTDKITSCAYMFGGSEVEYIPFDLNVKNTVISYSNIFSGCNNLKELPRIILTGKLTIPTSKYNFLTFEQAFLNCYKVREIPDDYFDNMTEEGYWEAKEKLVADGKTGALNGCRSLRSFPKIIYKIFQSYGTGYYNSLYNNLHNYNYSLDEVVDLPVETGAYTSNCFSNIVANCFRLKRFTFETNADGTPKTANWKNQLIILGAGTENVVGYAYSTAHRNNLLNANNGITADKEVKDDATYQALKNDPDWFTVGESYSRYNKVSALETISTLPDVSAGSGNTIRFRGVAGAKTDGGAINTMTEEEIAVATAKGWTVTFI